MSNLPPVPAPNLPGGLPSGFGSGIQGTQPNPQQQALYNNFGGGILGNQTGSDPTGGKLTPGAGINYGNLYGESQGMAGQLFGQGEQYGQLTPQVGDVQQMSDLSNYYENALAGKGPSAAQAQLQSGIDQSVATQMAMAASARGGAASLAGAQRAAQQGAGTTIAGGAAQSAALRAQEMQAAAQGLQGVGTTELQRLQANANLTQTNQAQVNQMRTALMGMGEQEQGLGLSAEQAYMANLLAAEGINTQQSQFNTQLGTQIAGAGLNAGGQIIGAAASDQTLKTDIQPEGMASLPPEPANAPAPPPANQVQAPNTGQAAGMGALSGAVQGGMHAGPLGALAGGAAGAATGDLSAQAAAHPQDKTLQGGNVAGQAGMGAASGALAGSALGPTGTAIGGIVGGIAGLVKGLVSDEDKKTQIHHAGGIATLPYHLEYA